MGGGTGPLCSGGVFPAPAAPADCSNLDSQFAALKTKFEALITKGLNAGKPTGGALAVVCGGQVRTAGVGTVRTGGAAVTSTTRFQLASMTKMLTAATAMSLAKKGTIDVAAPVSKISPSLGYGQVTLDQVLSHSAGLPTLFPNEDISTLKGWLTDSQNSQVALWAPPGAVWYYNNDGYAVAGALLEIAAAKPFATLVRDNTFGPFGLSHATMLVSELKSDFAYGHSSGSLKELTPNDSYYGDETYGPMGGAWASADDMGAWLLALLGHHADSCLLAPMMQRHIRTGVEPDKYYGYGLTIDQGLDPMVISHSGSVQGFLSDMEFIPDADVGVVALVNGDNDSYFPDAITVGGVKDFVTVNDVRPASPPASTRYPLIVGTYQSLVFGQVVVTQTSTGLQAEFVDHGYTSKLTQSPDVLYDNYTVNWKPEKAPNAPVTFWIDGTSPAKYMVSMFGVGTRQ